MIRTVIDFWMIRTRFSDDTDVHRLLSETEVIVWWYGRSSTSAWYGRARSLTWESDRDFIMAYNTSVSIRAFERGNFSHLLLFFSLERHKVPFRIGFLPFYVSPPPSPRLIASASMTASCSLTVLLNIFTKLVLTWWQKNNGGGEYLCSGQCA